MEKQTKIGITTLYYNSLNFGGVLQSYALCEVLRQQGYIAEQILVQRVITNAPRKPAWYEYFNVVKVLKKIKRMFSARKEKKSNATLHSLVEERKRAFESFYALVPHSEVYLQTELENCLEKYDAFITGSDQVWGCGEIDSPYFLGFVPPRKKKIAYAASIGKTSVDERLREVFESELDKFDGVSVREKDAVELLKPYTEKEVVWCLDPTLLLTRADWENIASERKIDKKYMLCYFLGDDKVHRKVAKEYAQKYGLKIVTFPHYPANFHKADEGFGDVCLTDASPQDFLALIKNADIVFTDSFHASVFSWHFEKEFFTFGRKRHKGMAGRLYSLMSLLELEGRFIEEIDKDSLSMIENTGKIDYAKQCLQYERMKEKSFKYLQKHLEE
ncbi:MAG: polysaccharide pyruvyl transferase family protein [Clostridiales bacterium]|nr:polysaccharide pyruvyl transferase family protein [Clostridiales bacterium]MBE5747628.1 polysaccharide pyruvyl transferase family protein [Clostridiales bacterium]